MAEIWGAAIAVGGGLLAGIGQTENQKQQIKENQQEDEENFQRQAWLAQQQRAWQLQDRAWKQGTIAGFSSFWNSGGNVKPVSQAGELGQLDNFDPNKKGSVGATNWGATGAADPGMPTPPQSATGPMNQLNPMPVQPQVPPQ